MRNLTKIEINTCSGGAIPVNEMWLGGAILVFSVACALIAYSWNGYYHSIDFSQLTPEEAYNKGFEDGYGYGYALAGSFSF